MTGHDIDKLTLTSYFTGDLDEAKHAFVEEHLAACGSCRAYIRELEAEKSAFLSSMPFASVPAKPKKKRIGALSIRKYYALAATVVIFIAGGLYYRTFDTVNYARIKGDTGIRIFSLDTNGTIVKRKNNVYHPGDRIQITYSCTDKHFFILFSIDEKGVVSKYYPGDTDSSIILEKGADIPLPNSIALDTYIGRELFIAVFSGHRVYLPGILGQVEDAFAKQGLSTEIAPGGDSDFDVHTVFLTKTERSQ